MIGDTVSHYRVVDKLGEGGMGTVYLAEDTLLERKVALKFLSAELERDEMARRRLLREAKSAAAIDHPFSCKIYEVGEANGRDFIAMEYIEGRTLREELRAGALAPDRTMEIAGEIAEALEEAEEKGIVHRDLKPANVMLTPAGHAKVMDFGLAKPTAVSSLDPDAEATLTALTQLGSVPGTPAYMSPEQARGREADRRSDVFSFGVLLYEMVSGRHPFLREGTAQTLAAILAESPPPLTQPDVPEPLRQLIAKSLQKDPEERYRSFSELTTALDNARQPDSSSRRAGNNRRPILGVAALVVALVAVLVVWSQRPAREQPLQTSPLDVEGLKRDDYESQASALMQNFSNPRDLALSVEAWQKVTALDPDRAAALAGAATARALVAWNSRPDPDLLETAEADAERALQIDPQTAEAYVALSIIFQMKGLLDTAATMSERSIELAPSSPWVLQSRARFLMDRFGEFAAAEKLARRAVEIDPGHFPAWFQLGWAQYELESLSEAAQSFRHSISLRPDFGAGYLGLGVVLNSQSEFEEARLNFDQALKIDGNSVQARFLQGISYHYLGDPAAALDNFSSIVTSNPDHLLAVYASLYGAVELAALGRPSEQAESLQAAELAFKAFPGMWWSLKGLAGVAALRGDSEQALAWLGQASQAGLYSVHQLVLDPALDSLKQDPRFGRMVEETRSSNAGDPAPPDTASPI